MHHYGHSLIVCQQEQCTRLYSEEELPAEFKLYLPVQQKGGHQVKQFCSLLWNCVAGSRGRCCCTRRGGSTNNAVVFASTLSHVNHKQLSNMKLRPATLFVTNITSNGQKTVLATSLFARLPRRFLSASRLLLIVASAECRGLNARLLVYINICNITWQIK